MATSKTKRSKRRGAKSRREELFATLGGLWTAREISIVEALTLVVRVLSVEQLRRGWFPNGDVQETQKRMVLLTRAGLVERLQVMAHPIIHVDPPVFHWSPGDGDPNEQQLADMADHLQNRWTEPEVPFIVYVAAKAAKNLFGSYDTDGPSDSQWTHDLHAAEVFLQLKENNSADMMQSVVGEGSLPKLGKEVYGTKEPDLFILDSHGQAETVLEFAGAYDTHHLKQLHEHCSGKAFRQLKERWPHRKHRLYPDPRGTEYLLF